ncbi:PREDICTED: aromatic-L-amino-acid decarboxylase-like [Nicrophorus vespilloides]|uniref:Aromatic-L-amino-acid decarboxylase-like n=1 Tax=Nicrophorus vespilloides TaxID=110193 RepID=A0ABM1M0Z4_NICVS|nr:PREDICTED: aromatic-L-amino-acid decarboxylase-like [Nicrophorus vespilloides]
MDVEEFRERGKEMVDYICQYMQEMGERRVTPAVEPGYLRKLLPAEAPVKGEPWEDIMSDVDGKIMPGVTHWQHPRFHAYFPSGNSYPSILGDMLSDAIGCIGFSWAASPACTELETIVMDWLGKAIGLPEDFITSTPKSTGGGVIQSSASECVLVSMLAARNQAINHLKKSSPDVDDSAFLPRLVAYCSQESHSCVEKAAMILLVKLRILDPDENCSLRGETLRKAMEEDEAAGLVPFFVSTTLGSTACCSFDNLVEIGPICRAKPSTWLHVDGAYAGNAFICPELKPLMAGIEYADSFNTNPNKWLLVNFDCSCLWVRDRLRLTGALVVDPLYLQHANSDEAIDYRHWGIPLSRRFRSLKLWFVIRKYGIEGLQAYIRNHIALAKKFEELVKNDNRFEIVNDVRLGLVCFRLKGCDSLNRNLLATINASGKLHMIPSMVKGKYIIRFCVVTEKACEADIVTAWKVINEHATDILDSQKPATPEVVARPPLTRQKSRRFSFTRSVSRDIYKRTMSKSNLHDGATPILIPDDETDSPESNDGILEAITNEDDDVFITKDFNDFSIKEEPKCQRV